MRITSSWIGGVRGDLPKVWRLTQLKEIDMECEPRHQDPSTAESEDEGKHR